MKVQNPHDKFFKELFSVRENALNFINGAFPAEIKDRIIPMIIYHGKSGWKKRGMSDYFNSKDNRLLRFVPNFDYLLTDLSSYTDGQIKDGTFKRAAIEIGLLMEKNIFNEKSLLLI